MEEVGHVRCLHARGSMSAMAKTVSASAFGKWDWLRRLARRDELLALVSGTAAAIPAAGVAPDKVLTPADLEGFGLTESQARLVCHDAIGVRARQAGQSFRKIAKWARPQRSYETWRNVVRLYLEYSDSLFAPAPGLKLAKRAREVITEDVLRGWSRSYAAGAPATGGVVELLGGADAGVTPRHALYWIRRRAKKLGLTHLRGLGANAD